MTVICWDGKTLAGDKRSTFDNVPVTTTKIQRSGHLLFGIAGDSARAKEMACWITNGRHPNLLPSFQRCEHDCVHVLLIEDGKPYLYQNSPMPVPVENRCAAIGTAAAIALALMHTGKSAREAVEITSLFDVTCGNGVDTLECQA